MSVCRPETEAKYRSALELYETTDLSCAEICRRCGVTESGFSRYVSTYHRRLMLRRNGIKCTPQEADSIKLTSWRRQRPHTHVKYRDAIEACDSEQYIGCNLSEIAREFGLDGTNLAKQLRLHYPDILERRNRERLRLGLDDNLPRGPRPRCRDQYAQAVNLLRSDCYITVRDAAERCNVSYSGLEQHLRFYHQELVDNRIVIRKKAVKQTVKGCITGRGTLHTPSPEIDERYSEALSLYRSTPLSARKIAGMIGVSAKGFSEYLRTWHKDLIFERNGVSHEEGTPIERVEVRRYNPAAAAKYAEPIARLKEGGLTTAQVATEFGLHPDTFRQYLRVHEPDLHASLGMKKTERGVSMASKSLEKYREAINLYATTTESIKSLARRFGFNDCSFGQFMRRQYPDLCRKHNELIKKSKKTK